jgi:hypothetical protein
MHATINSKILSPNAFLKSRRPERFSDTTIKDVTELDRSLLEFHLSSLTSRSQETDFERFARRLCEREICPNLLPQVGPTGGGDSKVDSETFPVADNLSLIWYSGIGQKASNERWAFAFSAKAKWRPKVQSDIKKVSETSREYKKAFFITNQSVPDRKRAEVEDALRTQYSIDVRILDRTWILDRVFEGEHETIAIEELGVTALSLRRVAQGPQDVKHEEELEQTEKRIQEAIQVGRINSSLVNDALGAADLARNLERPRAEIEGRYHRANQLAQKYGTPRQKVEAVYQWAWTLYFWFEEYDFFSEQYALVEELVTGSRNAYDLEQLTNLWYCLFTLTRRGLLDPQISNYSKRTEKLLSELMRLQDEEDRPSTALQAETLYVLIQITRRIANEKSPDDLLDTLQDVVLRSKNLVGYPLEPLVDILTEIGPVFEGLTSYDTLFETIVSIASAHDGEIRAARILVIRGEQQINQGRNVEAIATLGRALRLLYKNETRHDIVHALYLCGCAYDAMGLFWAAHGTLLSAASIATNEYWQYGDVTPYQAACYRRLKWVELQLGRLPYILSWHELDMAVRHALVDQGYNSEALLAHEITFEGLLGRLLLRTDFFDLKYMVALPDVLDQLGLELTSDALLYVLGHKERFEETCQNFGDDPARFASLWRSLKADRFLPNYPKLYNQQKIVLQSQILGCLIIVKSQNKPPCVELAESMLAALESLLATSTIRQAIAREPKLTVDVRASHFAETLVSFNLEEQSGCPHFSVSCKSFDPHKTSLEEQAQIKGFLSELIITVLAQIIIFKDYEQDLEVLLRGERAFERAIDFTGTFGTQANVLGLSPKTRLSSWVKETDQAYPLLRDKPWEPVEIEDSDEEDGNKSISVPKITEKNPPPSLLNPNLLKHDEMKTISLIRERLWERASWSGVAFAIDPTNKYPPAFSLIFKNQEAGREIFIQWREELGEIDKQEKLRLVIIRGIDQAHPYAYRVLIGSNLESLPTSNKFLITMMRIHRMDAATPDNLNRFLESHSVVDAFLLSPAFAPPEFDGSQTPEFENELGILIHSIHIRDAWEIGPGEIDAMGIQKGDVPIIPESIKKAPVHDLLKDME